MQTQLKKKSWKPCVNKNHNAKTGKYLKKYLIHHKTYKTCQMLKMRHFTIS